MMYFEKQWRTAKNSNYGQNVLERVDNFIDVFVGLTLFALAVALGVSAFSAVGWLLILLFEAFNPNILICVLGILAILAYIFVPWEKFD